MLRKGMCGYIITKNSAQELIETDFTSSHVFYPVLAETKALDLRREPSRHSFFLCGRRALTALVLTVSTRAITISQGVI